MFIHSIHFGGNLKTNSVSTSIYFVILNIYNETQPFRGALKKITFLKSFRNSQKNINKKKKILKVEFRYFEDHLPVAILQ